MKLLIWIQCFWIVNLVSLDLSYFNTSQVKDMNSMFMSYLSLVSLNLSNFNTGQVINMRIIFNNCKSLISQTYLILIPVKF